jgi:hypothetical protein
MKNVSNMLSVSTTITEFNRTSAMQSSDPTLSLALLALLALASVLPSHAQRTYSMPTYRAPMPQYHPAPQIPRPAPQYHAPAQSAPQTRTQSTPQPQTKTSSAPREQAPQQIPRPAPQYHAPAQSAPQTRTQSAPQPQTKTSSAPREQVPQQKEQAHQQKEAQKEQQKQQKIQANQQKEQQKQQRKQQKDQARQQQKQQKDEARQQKELQKKQTAKKDTSSAFASSFKDTARSSSFKEPATSAGSGRSSSGVSVLTARKSRATIQRLNSARTSMSGINSKPLPSGEVTVHSNGAMTVKAEGGRQFGVRPNGTVASYSDQEKAVTFNEQGKVSSVHTANLDMYHGPHSQSSIISKRADGSKVVSTGRHSGYVERTVVVNNKSYTQRTMIVNRRAYLSTFVAYRHGGVVVMSFVPPVFFAPRLYSWAYYPWATAVGFRWGWFGAPWYVGPNPYFIASPVYPSAAFWLTDYMIGETLATAYQMHNDDAMFDGDGLGDTANAERAVDGDSDATSNPQATIHANVTTPITPEIKSELAEEVKRELADDYAEAANPSQANFDALPAALQTPNHVFVLSTDLSVTTADQQTCALQAGDMLQVSSPATSDSSFVQLRVASSKRMDCPAGILVSVSLPDIQEMQNNFQMRVESGLEMLGSDQSLADLPAPPPAAVAAPPRPAIEGLPSLSAADSSSMLDRQREQADQIVKQAAASAF